MTKIKRAQLFILILLFWTKGSLEKKSRNRHHKKKIALSEEKTARSALIGIKPEELLTVRDGGASGSRKSDVNFLQQLPAIQDEERLTNSALLYSGQLSPIDQHLVKQFNKEVDVNQDDSKIDVGVVMDTSRQKAGINGTLRNGGMDKEFYSQISQIEQDQPQATNVGKLTDMYKDNPLPEYSYKESGYDKMSEYHPNDGSNPFEMPKNYYQDLDTQDKELYQGFNNYPEEPQHMSTDNSDLFSTIGKKVVLDLLKHRNDSDHQSEENLKQEFLKKLVEGNAGQNNMGINTLLAHKMGTTISPSKTQATPMMTTKPYATNAYVPTARSQGRVLTSGKISANDILGLSAEQVTQPMSLPQRLDLDIQGHVSQGDTPSRMIKAQSPNVPETLAVERPSLNKLIQTKDGDSHKENFVTLKISGAGKPVSFKAGTSNDGSLVLKIPGNVTLMNSNTNKVITSEAAQNRKEDVNSRHQMVTDAELMNHYLWVTQTAPTQEFAKKENMIEGQGETNSNNGMLSWQILGKTNNKFNQENDGNANGVHQDAHNVLPSLRSTKGRNFNDMQRSSSMSPTKYNELNRVSFAEIGQSPPPDILPPGLKPKESLEKNKMFSLKSFLRPSKIIEDSPENRARLMFGPDHDLGKTLADGKNDKRNTWSPCSVTCGQGFQARAQLCEGTQCKGYKTESKACFMQPCPEQLGRAGLRLHNKFRTWHKSPPLKWSQRLAAKAQIIANELADNAIRLSDLKEEGINVARLWHSYDIAAEKATADWYSEVKSFNFDDPLIDDSTKHFTQLIWKGSKWLGIGEAKSRDGNHTFVVALYDPPGNARNKERINVHMPQPESEK